MTHSTGLDRYYCGVDRLPVSQGPGRQHPLRHLPRAGHARRCRCRRSEVAESLDLHPNTVRPHLERMREVGLLEVEADSQGHRGPPPAPLVAGRRGAVTRPRAVGLPPAGPACSPRWRPWPASTRELVAEVGRAEGRTAGLRPGPRRGPSPASKPWSTSWPTSVSTRPSAMTARTPRSPSPTAPSGTWPGHFPSWCATCTGGSSRAWSTSLRRRRGRPSSPPSSIEIPAGLSCSAGRLGDCAEEATLSTTETTRDHPHRQRRDQGQRAHRPRGQPRVGAAGRGPSGWLLGFQLRDVLRLRLRRR